MLSAPPPKNSYWLRARTTIAKYAASCTPCVSIGQGMTEARILNMSVLVEKQRQQDYHHYEDDNGNQSWYFIGAPSIRSGYVWKLPTDSAMGIFTDHDYTDETSYSGGAYYAIRISKS